MKPLLQVNRYLVFEEIASGGMASVHFGRLVASSGFARTVAIKRLHPHIAKDPAFVSTLLDEARLASRIRHPNVVPTLDLVNESGEVFVVMEYVEGESLARVFRTALRAGKKLPVVVASAIVSDLLLGLHAAHEASDDHGEPLKIVHRDVSPQNVLVGLDGIARIVDFGVAKAASRMQTTSEGQLKGKLAYMSPEQLELKSCDRRADIFAAGIVSWELCTGRRLFSADSPAQIMARVLSGEVSRPTDLVPSLPAQLDEVILRALSRKPEERFDNALQMAEALNQAVPRAAAPEVRRWVRAAMGDKLEERARRLAEIESSSATDSSVHLVDRRVAADEVTDTDLSATTDPGARRRQKRRVMLAALALLAGLGLAAVLFGRSLLGPSSKRDAALGAASQEGIAAPPEPEQVPTEPAAPPPVTASTPPPPTASSQEPAPVTPPRPAARPTAVRPKPPPKPTKPQVNCNPNYYIDKHGQKRFKEECFK